MRFLDALKMALHNIWHNKSRTALTVVIVLIVGTLLMVLNIFALSFYNNMNNVSRVIFNEKGTAYYFYGYYDYSGGSQNQEPFNKKETDKLLSVLSEYNDVIDTVSFGSGDSSFSTDLTLENETDSNVLERTPKIYLQNATVEITSFAIPAFAQDGFMLEGRPWTKADRAKPLVWLTDKGAESFYKASGISVKSGMQFSYFMRKNSEQVSQTGSNTVYTAKTVTVAGIIDSSKFNDEDYQTNPPAAFFDAGFYLPHLNLEMSYKPDAADYDFGKVYGRVKALTAAINDSPDVRKTESGGGLFGGGSDRFRAEITSQMDMTQLIGLLVVGLVLGISLVIVLLSVGSIANSIIISTDKNKKFIGLMKALGLKNKGVNQIINLEAAIQIFVGIAVSFGTLLLVRSLIFKVLEMALGSIFRMMARGIEYTLALYMPIYIPLAVFGIFLAFALLSARGSLRTLGKMDVIAIMSESA